MAAVKVKAIAHSYWRVIKGGRRTFDSIPENVKDDVVYLAKSDVVNGVITEDEYEFYIGELYTETKSE